MASKRRRPSSRSFSSSSPREEAPQEISPEREEPLGATPRAAPSLRQSEKDTIGDILRRVREHRGEEIVDIAEYLRIRPGFLMALEESHYEKLPADAYAVGFLRSYAAYLGLDGKGAVNQYRREMAGHRKAPQLSMPQPMPEGRIPTAAILIVAFIFCALIYGFWYGLSSPDKTVITAPLPVPTEEVQPEEAGNEKAAAEETGDEKEPELLLSPGGEALSATPAGDLLLHTTTGAAHALSSLEQAQDGVSASLTGALLENKENGIALEGAAPVQTEEKKQEETKRYGALGQTRRVIRAKEKSWVLITDEDGNTRFDRVLQTGQSVHIPDGKKRFLTTGHAAGVEILLDGKALPEIHSGTQVIRDIDLDPDDLPDWIEKHNEEMED